MTEKKDISGRAAELRSRAEGKAAQSPKNTGALSSAETQNLLHELRVHQIELEMQNDELRTSQLELKAAQTRYYDLYNLAPVGYFTVSEQGINLEANLTAAILLDTPCKLLKGRPFTQFILPENRNIYHLNHRQLLKSGEMPSFDLQMMKQDGSAFWVQLDTAIAETDAGATVIRVVISDISKRKAIEAGLAAIKKTADEAREFAESIINTVREPLIVLNQDLRVVIASPSFYKVFKVNAEETVGQLIYDLGNKQWDIPKLRELLESILPRKTTFDNLEVEHVFADIGRRIMLLNARQIQRVSGNERILLLAIEDITERKLLEAEKARLEEQNQQLQKAESLGRMSGAIAHHFNNKLNVVMGYLEMVIGDLPPDDAHAEKLTRAMQSAQKASEVSTNLLSYLGQIRNKIESLDLSEICIVILPLLLAEMPKNVVMETDLPSPGPYITADAKQIQQILNNLAINAWEAVGEETGTVRLSVKTVPAADIPESYRRPLGWQPREQRYACLEVSDSGSGIGKKEMKNIFDPFFSTKFTGRGLGLPVVLGTAKTHKAVITVGNRIGGGSVFSVFFPLSNQIPLPPPVQIAKAPEIAAGGTVLLVEDDARLREMTTFALVSFGFTVLQARDGVEALEIFGKQRDEISCLLSDLTMPRMGGWETISALRALRHDLPVVLVSGYDEARVMAGEHSELPDFFLNKPYDINKLCNTIRNAIARKAMAGQIRV